MRMPGCGAEATYYLLLTPRRRAEQALEALPPENYGAKLLGLVGGRLLSCEAHSWRQSRIRDTVLQQVLVMHGCFCAHAAAPGAA